MMNTGLQRHRFARSGRRGEVPQRTLHHVLDSRTSGRPSIIPSVTVPCRSGSRISGFTFKSKTPPPNWPGNGRLAPYPGTVNEEGEVVRWDIVNGTSGMVFSNTDKPDESWTFLKWWMETETQTSFAYNLQSTYGPEYVWLSANLEAVANSPIEYDDKSVILNKSVGSTTYRVRRGNTCWNAGCPTSGMHDRLRRYAGSRRHRPSETDDRP
jgi:hypothetical protein